METWSGDYYAKLQENFKKICPDYLEPLGSGESQAIGFCRRVLFEIIESKRVDFEMISFDSRICFIKDVKTPHFVEDNLMIISISDARLLAMDVYCRLVDLDSPNFQMGMTPLAAAVIDQDRITRLADLFNVHPLAMLKMVNCSAQDNGHLLAWSDATLGVVFALASTREIDNKVLRREMVLDTLKKYNTMGKCVNLDLIEPIARESRMPAEYLMALRVQNLLLTEDEEDNASVYRELLTKFNRGVRPD